MRERFLRQKPGGTFRIVCMAGSATYGRPFWHHTSFAGWLRAFLPKAESPRKWEVINAGAISYATYRVKGLVAELARFEPDLFIAYMGHKEFPTRRPYADVLEPPGLVLAPAGWPANYETSLNDMVDLAAGLTPACSSWHRFPTSGTSLRSRARTAATLTADPAAGMGAGLRSGALAVTGRKRGELVAAYDGAPENRRSPR